MAVITVPKGIRVSGKIKVEETAVQVEYLINSAREHRRMIIVLHEPDGEELRIRWSLIQAVERR
jgi:hypothetical protein